MKNVLITNATDIYGGAEYFVLELAKQLRDRGYNIVVTCQPTNLLRTKCEEADLKVIPLDFPPQGKLRRYMKKLEQIIKDNNIELIHTNSNYDRTAGGFAAVRCVIPHVANIHSFHSIQYNVTHWVRNRWAVDRFIVVGHCIKELITRKDGIPPSKVSVVHLGIDPEEIRRDGGMRDRVRKEFGFSETDVVIGNAARLEPFKGHEFLLKAFGLIHEKYSAARVLIAGDGHLLEDLNRISREQRIESKAHFAGFRDDMQAVFSAMDIYCQSSVEGGGETFPISVLQALSAELPLVVTRVGDVACMVEDGSNGYSLAEKDVQGIAERLGTLLGNAELRREMGIRSRELLLREFTVKRMVDDIETIYREVLGRK